MLLTQTRGVVKLFTKSAVNTERLIDIQKKRIAENKPPFVQGINTSLDGDNSKVQTTEPLALVLDGETRWTGVGNMLKRTWRHLAPCIQRFFEERIEEAESRRTEKGKASALKKAQDKRMSRKAIRECQQISA